MLCCILQGNLGYYPFVIMSHLFPSSGVSSYRSTWTSSSNIAGSKLICASRWSLRKGGLGQQHASSTNPLTSQACPFYTPSLPCSFPPAAPVLNSLDPVDISMAASPDGNNLVLLLVHQVSALLQSTFATACTGETRFCKHSA